jgi:transposase-like protein
MSLRKDFVLRAVSGNEQMAALCREFGISRKTGYKWLKRFRQQGTSGLVDESRCPDSSPLATSAEIAMQIIQLRKERPTWGARKLWRILGRSLPSEHVPTPRTIQRVLDRGGLVKKRRYRRGPPGRPVHAPAVEVKAPNDLWTVDFKGWWRARDGAKCEPLTVRDAFSRFVFALRLLPRNETYEVQQVFLELFDRHGLARGSSPDWRDLSRPRPDVLPRTSGRPLGYSLDGVSGHGGSDRLARVSGAFRVLGWTSQRRHLPLGRRGGSARGRLLLGVVARAMTL